jgi:DNA polymerase III epsilon subunit-like protein
MKRQTLKISKKKLKKFLNWLKTVNDGDPVVLIGHNSFSFDVEVLETVASTHGIEIPTRVVAGYSDSCLAFRKNYNLEKNDLDSLAKHFGQPRITHDALEDSNLIKMLVSIALEEKSMTINQFFDDAFKQND